MRWSAALLLAALAAVPALADNVYKVDFQIRDGSGAGNATRHYTMLVNGGTKATFKTGSRVPVVTGSFQTADGKPNPLVNTQFTYVDVGVNIDCTVTERATGVGLNANIDLSLVAPPEKDAPTDPSPTINQIRLNLNADLQPGKSTAITSVEDPVLLKRFEVVATVTKVN